MADDWAQKREAEHDWQSRQTDNSENAFRSHGSAGNNNEKLARIMSAYEIAMDILGWEKPLSQIVTQYQASLDAKYHDDFVKMSIAERVSVLMKRNILTRNKNGGEDVYG